jgi:Lar family restriction alleviation protein
MSDLLPCPFCGNSAEIHHDDSSDYPSHWSFMVICQTADCVEGSRFKTEEDAAAAWNRRAALSQDTHSLPSTPRAAKPAGSGTPPSSPAGTNSTGDA